MLRTTARRGSAVAALVIAALVIAVGTPSPSTRVGRPSGQQLDFHAPAWMQPAYQLVEAHRAVAVCRITEEGPTPITSPPGETAAAASGRPRPGPWPTTSKKTCGRRSRRTWRLRRRRFGGSARLERMPERFVGLETLAPMEPLAFRP